MKLFLRYILLTALVIPASAKAQFDTLKDSLVELYGVVMTADSLQALPYVTVIEKQRGRGTITNSQGVFNIVVPKGDVIEFSSVGFKPKTIVVPRDIQGNQYSVLQLMVTDTVYLAATIIKSRPTREQFERDFINTNVPADNLEIARQNNDENRRRLLMSSLPRDGREAANSYLSKQAGKYSYAGQAPPQNIFNPFAWADFIKSWKRGDFKKKN